MREELEEIIQKTCQDLFDSNVQIQLTRPEEQFGEYATSVALHLAKTLNKNPSEIAKQIAENVKGRTFHIQELNVAGPGFINLRLTDEALIKLAQEKPAQSLAGK